LNSGNFFIANGIADNGTCILRYAGGTQPEDTLTNPINFLQNGASCYNFHISLNDGIFEARAHFRDSFTDEIVTLSELVSVFLFMPPGVDVCIPYGNQAGKLEAVDLVEVEIRSVQYRTDAAFSYICSQPIVSCWHTISSIGEIDLQELSVGDKIEIRVTCQNYNSLPATTENIIATLAFDTSIAVIDSSSLVCVNTKSRIAIGGVLAFTATLDENEEVSCSVIVGMVGPGQIDNIGAAIVTDAREDPPIRSNEGSSVQGTAAFCEPPTLSSINVGGQDPTVPVQTSCQSHARCFRLVQENDCIFASNCVDNVCAVFCHDRFECILDPLCANSFWDQSDI